MCTKPSRTLVSCRNSEASTSPFGLASYWLPLGVQALRRHLGSEVVAHAAFNIESAAFCPAETLWWQAVARRRYSWLCWVRPAAWSNGGRTHMLRVA